MDIDKIIEKLERCKKMTLDNVDINEIDDINDIKIDKRKSSNERILDFLNEVKNPYFFKVNGKIVQISFSDTDKTAEDCLNF